MGAQPLTPAASLRQLIDSLNREQRRTQELLASLGFALRSFTNLSRFLELVPLLTAASGASSCTVHPPTAVRPCCSSWRC